MSFDPNNNPYMTRTISIAKHGAWIDSKNPKVYLCQGMRGGGKSLLNEMIAEQLFLRHWTVLDLLGARTLENLYWCINKNHRDDYLAEVRVDQSKKGIIHCNCNTRYPITILCPEYISFDQDTIDTFNHKYITKPEFVKLSQDKNSKYYRSIEYEKLETGIKPMVKVRKLQPPTVSGSNRDVIIEQFYEAVMEARKERRIICMNPKLFPNEFHRYKTLELIIRSLEAMMYKYFKPPTEESTGKAEKDWGNKEKNSNKVCVVMREFGEVTANILKGENQSTLTKKALLQYIRQTRHYGITLIGDYQRPDDVFPAIRQQSDIFLIKRAPAKLLGQDWEWLFDEIEKKRQKIFDRWGFNPSSINFANKRYPLINQLADNYCYVIWIDNSFKLVKIPSPNFHHKRQEEHFENDTGIIWTEGEHSRLTKSVGKSETAVIKQFEQGNTDDKLFKVIADEIGEDARPNWDRVLVKVTQLAQNGVLVIPVSWNNKENIRKWYSRKKKRVDKLK